MRILVFVLAPLFCVASAQTPGAKLEFEVASVKPSVRGPDSDGICRGGPGYGDPVLFTCRYVDLRRIIVRAFGVRPFQLAAPDWANNQRFDIRAAVPAGATKDQFEVMLQNLLIERFHLAFHREPREMSRYELLVAEGGPKLKDAQQVTAPPDEAAPAPRGLPDRAAIMKRPLDKDGYPMVTGRGWSMVNGRARFHEPDGGFGGLLLLLEMTMGKPVADATGLKGSYEIEMRWVGESPLSGQMGMAMAQARANAGVSPAAQGTVTDPGPSGPTIQQALRDQLGLKLELKKGPVETLVIDHVDKVPTEN
jgi:uncharacterized protein (TIGR03435 family)